MDGVLAHLDETPFVVVDTETTGLRAGEDRIIEVAAVRVRGGRIESRFQQLINPQRPIPPGITRLTGISDKAVSNQPTADTVMPRLLEFLQDAVLVAHNLAFDRRFLDMELRRSGLPPIQSPSLCTLRLARRVLHALPSKSLSSLKQYFGIRTPRAHRALDDAEATAMVLHRLIEALRSEQTIDTASALLRMQFRPHQATIREPAHIRRLKTTLRETLPDEPGVYFHTDSAGRVLYVGKARNLRHRVLSYFTAVDNHPEHLRRLLREVRDVTWISTPSELVALLEESRLIKHHCPRFNRAQREYSLRPLLRIETSPAHPGVALAFEVRNDGSAYFGPIGSRARAEDLIRLARELFGLPEIQHTGASASFETPAYPEASAPDRTADAAQSFQCFLAGQDPEVQDRLQQLMLAAASERRYEDAAWYRNQIALLEDRAIRGIPIARSILDHHGVAIVPSGKPGFVEVVCIAHGRHRHSLSIPQDEASRYTIELHRMVAEAFLEGSAADVRYREVELDEVQLVASWMATAARAGAVAGWTPGTDPEAFVRFILDKVEAADQGVVDTLTALDES